MNQLDNASVSPVYMSQTEANEVMELWAQRQREEAERHGMVTVHDVAEATQLSPQEVQQLLQSVRMSRENSQSVKPIVLTRPEDIPLVSAIIRVLPFTGIVSFLRAIFLDNRGYYGDHGLVRGLIFWTIAMAIFAASKHIYRLANDARLGRAMRKKMRLSSDR